MIKIKNKKITDFIKKFENIGPRPIGSSNLKEAGMYIKDYFENIGLNTEIQEYNSNYKLGHIVQLSHR
ncbi:MAG: hypothetical protein KGD57_10190 [Candidatus Lokiarchaeota archaeon]|nr:hypothetical protein [Candidatus Lokiarchaeota archaeon]